MCSGTKRAQAHLLSIPIQNVLPLYFSKFFELTVVFMFYLCLEIMTFMLIENQRTKRKGQ
jgi:hypothetical protein